MTASQAELRLHERRQLPLVRAAAPAESGLACLVMLAAYYGRSVSMNDLRQRFLVSGAGLSFGALLRAAERMDFSGRIVRVESAILHGRRPPVILELGPGHYAVLKRLSRGKKMVVHDPLRGERTLDLSEVAGAVLELGPAAGFAPGGKKPIRSIRHLWSSSHGVGSGLGQVFALTAALQVVAFAAPFQMQLVIDEGIFRSDKDLLLLIALCFGTLLVLQHIIEALRAWTLQIVSQYLSFSIAANLVRHLLRLPHAFFERRHLGDVLSRLGSAKVLQDILTKGVITAVLDGVMAAVALIILFMYSATLTWIVVGSVLLLFLINHLSFPLLRARNEEELAERAKEQTTLMELVRSTTIIKLMGREAERESVWRNQLASATNAASSFGKLSIGSSLLRNAVAGIQSVLVVYLGARMVVDGDGMSIGMLVAYLSFRATFTERMLALSSQIQQFRFIGLHLDRLSDITDAEAETTEAALLKVEGAITLTDVSFRYGSFDKLVLNKVALDIAAGEFVAITGPSGSGKTTLLKMLLGLERPTEGSVSVDGHPATPEIWRAWRENAGVVVQDDRLISGSIAENIAFFDPDMDMERVRDAAARAQIDDDVSRMPLQYSTLIGDMGSALSAGQRQRLWLARAFYRQPKILVLDEGTANLDIRTEAIIAELIRGLPITRIVVAHRPALIEAADRVIRVVGGTLQSERPSEHVALS